MILQERIKELEKELELYKRALRHSCYMYILKTIKIAMPQYDTQLEIDELVKEYLKQARKELANGK